MNQQKSNRKKLSVIEINPKELEKMKWNFGKLKSWTTWSQMVTCGNPSTKKEDSGLWLLLQISKLISSQNSYGESAYLINRTPRTYCCANTEDLETVVHHVHSLYPSASFLAAGVSMGGMLLLNYLGKIGSKTPLMAAATFSVGWNTFACSESLEKPLNWLLFNYYLTTCLQSSVNKHRHMFVKQIDMDHVMKAKSIREFDKRFTAVMFGYRTIDDYYTDASPNRRLKSVGIPVLCLNSVDDVFSPSHAIPIETAKQNPNVALVLTSYGGHIGFLEGIWPRQSTYMDRVFKQFVQAAVEHGHEISNM
ncbi:phospholipase ABHD3 [Orycteropus afer afer]|uniref:Phospholipase ABHD3 n=1 Tax=Orycteropus afer afer TaxID=1230840 RepID=A0AC54Z6C5_ORYAF|nr:phospholipase ABHD3 [Orycteropus afer afer]